MFPIPGSRQRRIVTSPLKVFSRKSPAPPPFSEPRKLRRLLLFSVTGRSLSKLPLKLLKSMLPRALAGSRNRTSPLKVLTSMSLPSPSRSTRW